MRYYVFFVAVLFSVGFVSGIEVPELGYCTQDNVTSLMDDHQLIYDYLSEDVSDSLDDISSSLDDIFEAIEDIDVPASSSSSCSGVSSTVINALREDIDGSEAALRSYIASSCSDSGSSSVLSCPQPVCPAKVSLDDVQNQKINALIASVDAEIPSLSEKMKQTESINRLIGFFGEIDPKMDTIINMEKALKSLSFRVNVFLLFNFLLLGYNGLKLVQEAKRPEKKKPEIVDKPFGGVNV